MLIGTTKKSWVGYNGVFFVTIGWPIIEYRAIRDVIFYDKSSCLGFWHFNILDNDTLETQNSKYVPILHSGLRI